MADMVGTLITRRAFSLALFSFVTVTRRAEAAGFHITGRLDCTEEECQEGYFNIGHDCAIVARRSSPIHDDLLAMRGTNVQCSVFNP